MEKEKTEPPKSVNGDQNSFPGPVSTPVSKTQTLNSGDGLKLLGRTTLDNYVRDIGPIKSISPKNSYKRKWVVKARWK